jgi:hypothetical protein
MSYAEDVAMLRDGAVDDGVLRFTRRDAPVAGAAADAPPAAVA